MMMPATRRAFTDPAFKNITAAAVLWQEKGRPKAAQSWRVKNYPWFIE